VSGIGEGVRPGWSRSLPQPDAISRPRPRATKADAEAVRIRQGVADSSAQSQRSLQQERDKTARLERELAAERKTKDVPAGPGVVTVGRVTQDKPPPRRTRSNRPQ
jgi:hypothetical protein